MLYKDNIFDLVVFTTVSIFIFVTTNHVNHWTSPITWSSKFKMEDLSVEADKNLKSNKMSTSLGKIKGL